MDRFIEQLYWGNIDPQARCYPRGSKAELAALRVNISEEELKNHLAEEDQHFLDEFCSAYLELISLSGLDSCTVGFRLGARMALDTFCIQDAPFEEIRSR